MSRYTDGLTGLIVGDALGGPVQFMTRKEVKSNPVTDMEAFRYEGGYPAGTWSDDGSMALATYDSIKKLINKGLNEVDYEDIMENFLKWYDEGEYTPTGFAFDEGGTTCEALEAYKKTRDLDTCGQTDDWSNGNGSIMRILPMCIFCFEKEKEGVYSEEKAMEVIERTSALTHAHIRSKIGCGLYYKVVKEILEKSEGETLEKLIQQGIDAGANYYDDKENYRKDLYKYRRLLELFEFKSLPEAEIQSGGYVVETLEAAIWALITTDNFKDALLKVVNLGDDSDTTGAVTGGLAALYYGIDAIPKNWLEAVNR